MAGQNMLRQARAAGLTVRVEGAWLVVRGPRSRTGLAEALLARKAEIVALLAEEEAGGTGQSPPPAAAPHPINSDPEVAWRVEAMRERLRTTGIPRTPGAALLFLTVRDVPPRHPGCMSCGLALGLEEQVRCRYCARAARIVTEEYAAGRNVGDQ